MDHEKYVVTVLQTTQEIIKPVKIMTGYIVIINIVIIVLGFKSQKIVTLSFIEPKYS